MGSERSLASFVGFFLLGGYSIYAFASGGRDRPPVINVAPEVGQAVFAAVPKNKPYVKLALKSGVGRCFKKYAGDAMHPMIVDLVSNEFSGLVDSDSAREGKVPSQLEIDAYFSNYLLNYIKQNKAKLNAMPQHEIDAMDAGNKLFDKYGPAIFVCGMLEAHDELVRDNRIIAAIQG